MNRLLVLLLAGATAGSLSAREPTLIESPPDYWNFYFQPQFRFSQIKSDNAEYAGAEIGASFNDTWDYGVEVNVLVNDLDLNNPGLADPREAQVWDAGFHLRRHLNRCGLVDPSLNLYVGGGRIDVGNKTDGDNADTDFVFIEPSFQLGVNLSEHFVIGLGVGYRIGGGADSRLISNEDLSSFSGLLFLRIDEF
jgi:hypothetical protein